MLTTAMFNVNDIIGKVINGIEVLSYSRVKTYNGMTNGRIYLYVCKCHCGKQREFTRGVLIKGKIKSCGCFKPNKTHGDSGIKFHKIWCSMILRVTNKNQKGYKNYGGRGITVCERWRDYVNFRTDMKESYDEHSIKHGVRNTTIERIDVNGNYCPENCRWATMKEQSNNVRSNVVIEYNGEKGTISYFSDKYNIKYGTLYCRIVKLKWDVNKAIEEPLVVRDLEYIRRCTKDKMWWEKGLEHPRWKNK